LYKISKRIKANIRKCIDMSAFLDRISERARAEKKTIVLPETSDIRVIKAASMVLERGIANVILVGNEKSIKELAAGINIEGAVIVDPENSDKMEDYSNYFYELRKHKGMTVEKAKETLKDPL
jgi:phosphate acetyltransferase